MRTETLRLSVMWFVKSAALLTKCMICGWAGHFCTCFNTKYSNRTAYQSELHFEKAGLWGF